MINWERLSERVFGIIRGAGFRLVMFDQQGQEVTNPQEARRFFVRDPNFMVSVNQDLREIQVNRNETTRWEDIKDVMRMLRNLNREFMVKVGVRVYGKAVKPKDTAYQARMAQAEENEEVLESNMYGRAKTSYQPFGESTRLVIKHGNAVDPEQPGSRSRSIRSLFVEHQGQRYPVSTRDLGAGRAIANHLSMGGAPGDDLCEHIEEMAQQLETLQTFAQYNRRKQFMEDDNAQDARELAREHAQHLRGRVREFAESTTYDQALERFQSGERDTILSESDPELMSHYTQSHVDPRVERALPIVSALRERRQAQILEASRAPFPIGPQVVTEDDIMESDDPRVNMGIRLRALAARAVESSPLSCHVTRVAESLISGGEITEHDQAVVRNVLANVVLEGQHEI